MKHVINLVNIYLMSFLMKSKLDLFIGLSQVNYNIINTNANVFSIMTYLDPLQNIYLLISVVTWLLSKLYQYLSDWDNIEY